MMRPLALSSSRTVLVGDPLWLGVEILQSWVICKSAVSRNLYYEPPSMLLLFFRRDSKVQKKLFFVWSHFKFDSPLLSFVVKAFSMNNDMEKEIALMEIHQMSDALIYGPQFLLHFIRHLV